MEKTIDQQIEDIKNKIKALNEHEAFITSQEYISNWDREHVVSACGRIQRKMEKDLRTLLIAQVMSGKY